MILILVIRKSEQAKTIAVLKMLLRTEQGLSLSNSQRVHFPVPFHLYAQMETKPKQRWFGPRVFIKEPG